MTDTLKPLDWNALDANDQQVDQLDASRRFALDNPPEKAAPALGYARQAGIDFEAAKSSMPQTPKGADWGQLVKDNPILSTELADKGFASVAQDDVPNLSVTERLFGGWTNAVDVMNWKGITERDALHKELANIGKAQRYGQSTPEMDKRADEIEKKMSSKPEPSYGFVSGIIPGMVGMLPALARASNGAAAGMAGGVLAGIPGGPATMAAGGAAGASVGFTAGMVADTANTEQGIAFREYRKLGVPEESAAVAADIVALANGALAGVQADKIFSVAPGVRQLLVGKGARDLMRRVLTSNTGAAAIARFSARVAQSGLTMALLNNGMELVKEIGAIGAGATDHLPDDWASRHWETTKSGAQVGIGFGVVHGIPHFGADMAEVRTAESRKEMYKAIGQLSTDSKLRERMPEEYKRYVNRVIDQNGGPVQEAKAPAEKLVDLFQKEGMEMTEVAKKMPEVARQIADAADHNDMGREVVIPMGDLATHIAPLKTFDTLHEDLRVGDELTPREGKEVAKQVEKDLAAEPKPAGADEVPAEQKGARAVYDDVFDQLVNKAGHAPEQAAKEAVLWAHFAAARAKRLGVDAFDYYKKRGVEIGASFVAPDGSIELAQTHDFSRPLTARESQIEDLVKRREELRKLAEAHPEDYNLRPEWREPHKAYMEARAKAMQDGPLPAHAYYQRDLKIEPIKFTNDVGVPGPNAGDYLHHLMPRANFEKMLAGEDFTIKKGTPVSLYGSTHRLAERHGSGDDVLLRFEMRHTAGYDTENSINTTNADVAGEHVQVLAPHDAAGSTWKSLDELAPERELPRSELTPRWASAAEKAAATAKQAKGDAKSWKSVLSKGTKKEELAYLGVNEWLDRADAAAKAHDAAALAELGLPADFKGTLTREQVLKYINDHKIDIKEMLLEKEKPKKSQAIQQSGLPDEDVEAHEQTLRDANIDFNTRTDGSYRFSYYTSHNESEETHDIDEIINYMVETGSVSRRDRQEIENAYQAARNLYDDPESAVDWDEVEQQRKEQAEENEETYVEMDSDERERYARDYVKDLIDEYAKQIEDLGQDAGLRVRVDSDGELILTGEHYTDQEVTLTDPDEIESELIDQGADSTAERAREAMDALNDAYPRTGQQSRNAPKDPRRWHQYTLDDGNGNKVADDEYRELLFLAPGEGENGAPAWTYTSHYDTGGKGLLGHVRFSEHVIDGKKMMVVEEVQTDRFQKARLATRKAEKKIKRILEPELKAREEQTFKDHLEVLIDSGREELRPYDELSKYLNEIPTREEYDRMMEKERAHFEQEKAKDIAAYKEKIANLKVRTGFESLASTEARMKVADNGNGKVEFTDPVYGHTWTGRYAEKGYDARMAAVEKLKKQAAHNLLQEILDNREAVLDAPFKANFEEMAMKRLILWAAEKGYDRIGWTTGDQQVERWSDAFRQKADTVTWELNDDGTYRVAALKNGSEVWTDTIQKDGLTENEHGPSDDSDRREIDEVFGDVGKKIEASVEEAKAKKAAGEKHATKGSIREDRLIVGGAGMKMTYDRRLGSTAKAIIGTEPHLIDHPGITKEGERYYTDVSTDPVDSQNNKNDLKDQLDKRISEWRAKATPPVATVLEAEHRSAEIDSKLAELRQALAEHEETTRGGPLDLFAAPPGFEATSRTWGQDADTRRTYRRNIAQLETERERIDEWLNANEEKRQEARDEMKGAQSALARLEEIYRKLDTMSITEALGGTETRVDAGLVKQIEHETNADVSQFLSSKRDTEQDKIWATDFPEAKREEVKKNGINLFQPAAEGYRGKISFDEARSWMQITLTGKANLSTFLHETGHAFLEYLRMDALDGDAQSQAEWQKISRYLGSLDGKLSEDQLEYWARSFEEYLREGKAPAPGLVEAFRAFSNWIKFTYRKLAGLGVHLTDEVRGVMDRMLAADDEIAKAQEGLGLKPMADMPEIAERFNKAMEAAKAELEGKAISDVKKLVGGDRQKVRQEVEAKAALDPEYNAYEALRTGRRLDGGAVPDEVAGKKLSRAAVEELLAGDASWSRKAEMRARLRPLLDDAGMDPEVAAPYFGYGSGEEMVKKIGSKPSRSKTISEEVDARMKAMYPDADIATMTQKAVEALHSDAVGEVLWREAAAVAKRIGKDAPRTVLEALKQLARRQTDAMTQIEMQPGRFSRAESKAAQEWVEAYRKGDFNAAHEAKLRQLKNHELYKAVTAAKEEFDGITGYLRKFEEMAAIRRLGRAGQHYVDAVQAILSDIELSPRTNKQLARRASLESFLKTIEDEGGTVSIPPEVRAEVGLKNVRQMTLEDLRTVRDAVKNIEAQAQFKNRLFDGRQKRQFQQTAVKLSSHVSANLGNKYGEKPGDPQNPGWWESKKEWLRKGSAQLKKIEFLAREMDGGQTAGFAHELIFQPFATAEEKKNIMYRKVIGDLMKPMHELSLRERLRYDRTVDFLGTPMKLRDVLAVALNMGNDGNKTKLLKGYGYRGWTEDAALARLGELLNDKDLDLVEHVMKTVGSLWPEIEALSRRTTGLAPPKVEATPFVINGRKMEGGYYPIVYDRRKGYKAEQIAQKKADLFENNFLLPATSKGFTESRTKFFAPIELSMMIIPNHINEVVHYLTHYEPVRAVDRLLNHKLVRSAITEGQSREVYNLMRPWLQSIANDGVISEGATVIDGIFRHLRVGSTLTALGGKLSTALLQSFDFLGSVKELGPKYAALGIGRFLKEIELSFDPFKGANERFAQVRDFEKQMSRELLNDFDNQLSLYADLGHMKDRVAHFSLSLMGLVQKTVNVVIAYGAYEKAIAENHPRPNEYADSIVRLSQMGEGIKDKSAIQRGGELTKTFTMLYSYFNVLFNQLAEKGPRDATAWQKVSKKAATWWWLVTLPVALDMLLGRGQGQSGDEDAAAKAKRFALGQFQFASRGIPGWSMLVDTLSSDGDPRYAPWMTTMLRSMKARAKAVEGEDLSDKDKKDIVDSIGIGSHLPTTGARNAYRYLEEFQNGNLEEPVQDLLFRSPADWK